LANTHTISDGHFEKKAGANAMDAKLKEAEKALIREEESKKDAKLLADILAHHPELTKEKALEMLRESGF
jgi:hypothetical protein